MDLELIEAVTKAVNVPVICGGGVGCGDDIVDAANAGAESDTATATETATGQDSQVPDSDTGVSESASAPSADSETVPVSAGGCKSGLAGGALLLVAAGIALATVMTAALPRRKKQ